MDIGLLVSFFGCVVVILAQASKIAKLERERALATQKLEVIVCTVGCDAGVVMLSEDGPTHWDPVTKCYVYDHEYFSPLGDALIDLHQTLKGEHERVRLPAG